MAGHWDLWSAPTLDDEWRLVQVREVDLSGVPPEFASHRFPGLTWEQWLARDAIALGREYNWRAPAGEWQRLYVGVGNGRHRLLQAKKCGVDTLKVQVPECAFFPAGQRPPDRTDAVPAGRCFEHDDFDVDLRRWLRTPAIEHERAFECR